MKKTFLVSITVVMVLLSCGEKKPAHSEFPDQLQVSKTAGHVRILNSSIFVLAPEGFSRQTDERGVLFQTGRGNHESLLISRQPTDAELPIDIKSVKKQLFGDIITVKQISYNGKPGVFLETKNYNVCQAELRVPQGNGEMLRLIGEYRADSDPSVINKIMMAMQQVLYDDTYQPDMRADQAARIQLSTSGSSFKLAETATDPKAVLHYYYTRNGAPYTGNPPYLWVFESKIYFEGITGNVKADNNDFPSFKDHLKKNGFMVEPVQMPYQLNPTNHRVSYYEGTDETTGISVSLLLYEVKNDQTVIVMVGVAKRGDQTTINELKRLASTIKIVE